MKLTPFPFTDFCLLALIIALVGGLSALEVLSHTAGKRRREAELDIPLRRAATWSLVGVIVTLLYGALSHTVLVLTPYTDAGVAVPLVFLGYCLRLHMQGSTVVSRAYLENEADDYYLQLIEDIVRRGAAGRDSATDNEFRKECIKCLPVEKPWWSINAVSRFGSSVGSPALLENLLGSLALNEKKFKTLADKLVRKGRLCRDQNGCLQPSPETPETPNPVRWGRWRGSRG